MIYDSLLVFGVLFSATIPAVFLQNSPEQAINNEQVVNEVPILADGPLFQLYLLSVYMAFFCWFWRRNGQTLGMQAWRLQIQDLDGGRISVWQCLKRLLGAMLSALCFGAGYWWMLLDKEQRCWHDRLSQSRVVVLPKQP